MQRTIVAFAMVSALSCAGGPGEGRNTRHVQDPCSLVTQEELEAILQAPLGPAIHEDNECIYEAGGQPLRSVTLTVHWEGGHEELRAARAGVALFNQSVRSVTDGTAAPSSTLDGVGDDAFFVMAGFMPMLYARVDDTAITIESFGANEDEIVEIARTVLARIKGSSR